MNAFQNLTNAAREFIAERLDTIEKNDFFDYTPQDLASVQREHGLIEQEIANMGVLLDAVSAIANMVHPSIENLLRQRGRHREADRVANLVRAVEAINTPDQSPQHLATFKSIQTLIEIDLASQANSVFIEMLPQTCSTRQKPT